MGGIGEYWIYGQIRRVYLDYGKMTKGYQALLGVLKATDI